MKSILQGAPLGRLFTAGLLLAVCGCTQVPLSQSTRELSTTPALARSAGENVVPPSPSRMVRPEYPFDMKRAGMAGTVRLNVLVDADGAVQSVSVLDSDADSFTGPAINAVRQWTFTPGRRNGVAVPMRVSLPIAFRFDDE